MGQNEYSVIISQRVNGDGTVQTPIALELVHHEGDMQYLTDAVNTVVNRMENGGRYRRVYGKDPYMGADYTFEQIGGNDMIFLFVRTPYGGWNL